MEQTLARFVHALRSADIAVSPAETLDALAVARTVGLDDPRRLHDALSLALALALTVATTPATVPGGGAIGSYSGSGGMAGSGSGAAAQVVAVSVSGPASTTT